MEQSPRIVRKMHRDKKRNRPSAIMRRIKKNLPKIKINDESLFKMVNEATRTVWLILSDDNFNKFKNDPNWSNSNEMATHNNN